MTAIDVGSAAPGGSPASGRARAALVASVTDTLAPEFGTLPIGRILAVVVRCIADLERVTGTPLRGADIDPEVEEVLADLVRARLHLDAGRVQ